MTPLENVLSKLDRVRQHGGYWTALCPAHEDNEPSLSIKEGEKGRVLLHCFTGCPVDTIAEALSLGTRDLFRDELEPRRNSDDATVYDYRSADGKLVYQACRLPGKQFRQRQPDGRGSFVWHMKGVDQILYRLPDVLEAVANGELVLIVEGEKDADRLHSLGFVATTKCGGAASQWRDAYSEALRGARVVILPDNDAPGREVAQRIAKALRGVATEVAIVELPDLPEKGDVSDWLNAGGTVEELRELLAGKRSSAPPVNGSPPRARATRWTASELQGVVFPEPRWAVPGLIAEGATLVVGPPKVGKSWLALNIACSVAQGGKALGRVSVDAGDVLYLALEDNGRRVQSRLQIVMGDTPWPERLSIETWCETLSAGGAARIEQWLDEHPDARLIVVDVLTRVRDHDQGRKSAYAADYDSIAAVKEIADRREVAVLIVHHVRKASAEDYVDAVSGTNGLAGAADAILVLARSRGRAEATLKVTGRDIEEAEHALNFAADIGTWQLLDGPASDYEQSSERASILAAVREAEGISPKAISEASGVKHDVVKHLVRKMVDRGDLDTDGEGHYSPGHRSPHSPVHSNGEQGEQSEWAPEEQSLQEVLAGLDSSHPDYGKHVAEARAADVLRRRSAKRSEGGAS